MLFAPMFSVPTLCLTTGGATQDLASRAAISTQAILERVACVVKLSWYNNDAEAEWLRFYDMIPHDDSVESRKLSTSIVPKLEIISLYLSPYQKSRSLITRSKPT